MYIILYIKLNFQRILEKATNKTNNLPLPIPSPKLKAYKNVIFIKQIEIFTLTVRAKVQLHRTKLEISFIDFM